MISKHGIFYSLSFFFLGCLYLLPVLREINPYKAQNVQIEGASSDGSSNHCYVNITQDFNENQPLLLRHNSSEILYPRIQNPSSFEMNIGKAEIRVACPNDLLVADNNILGIGTAYIKCHGAANFGIAGSQTSTPFNRISCTKSMMPQTRIKRSNCPIGKCMQIGFQLNIFTFLPIIDMITYDVENKVPIWAHSKIAAVIENRQKSSEKKVQFRIGPLLHNATIEISDIYHRDFQRKRLHAIFGDADGVEWYINDMIADDSKYFVEGQLVSQNDFFYRSQQQSTYYYENVVPMWRSVHDGNWLYVSEIVRRLASETMTDLDVWSGGIGVLTMHNSNEVQRKIYLTRDTNGRSVVPAPKILFKYVYDRRANRGLVFLVVNNPHLDKIGQDYVICKRQTACESMFPQFSRVDKGYAYCCTLDGFLETAKSLGLPTFAGATSIGS